MPTLPTFDQIYQLAQSAIVTRDARLTNWQKGSALDAIAGAASILTDMVLGFIVSTFSEHFVYSATGTALDALALDRYGLSRTQAAAAIGTLTFTRGSGTFAIPIAVGTLVEYKAADGTIIGYTTDAAVTIPFGGTSIDVAATAVATGAQGNAPAGGVTSIPTPPTEDPSLTVANAERFAGGRAAETDVAFRSRISAYNLTLRKGTLAALEAGAKSVPGVAFATVDESTVPAGGGGFVSVYVGDPDGAGNTALADKVRVELDNWRCAGVQVQVFAAAQEYITLALTVTYKAGANTALLKTDIEAAVLSYVGGLASNETLYTSRIETLCHNVDPLNVLSAVAAPSTTTPTQTYNALRLKAADITITFVAV